MHFKVSFDRFELGRDLEGGNSCPDRLKGEDSNALLEVEAKRKQSRTGTLNSQINHGLTQVYQIGKESHQ